MSLIRNNNSYQALTMYFQVHQPLRLASFNYFTIGSEAAYFDDELNRSILTRIANECYLPTNERLLGLILKYPTTRIAFSISGTTLDQLNEVAPEVVATFRSLADTGAVEFLCETSHHSLASVMKGTEFEEQVLEQSNKILHYLGVRPTVFRNTELIYNDTIGSKIHAMGFLGIFSDGVEKVLDNRSPHHVYAHPEYDDFKILLRSYRLSDDIAFRFNHQGSALSVDQYMAWLMAIPEDHQLVNLAMDYETFGEHHKQSTGILTFLEELISRLAAQNKFQLSTPSEAILKMPSKEKLSVPQFISWADQERDLSAWLGNDMQRDAFDTVTKLEAQVKELGDHELLSTWRNLLMSDHFYYMSTKKQEDGSVHAYFSHYPSPYEAFINYMNVVSDFTLRLEKAEKVKEEESFRDGASYEHDRRHQVVPEWAHKIENQHFHIAN